MKTDGVLFDLDGTLWDSCQVVSDSWALTLRSRYGSDYAPSVSDVRGIMGLTADEIARRLFARFGSRAGEVCRACIAGENEYIARRGGQLYPGLAPMLASLSQRLPLFIVSNCLDGYIQAFLQSSGLGPYFTDFTCEGVTGLGKADNIRLLAQRHGLRAPAYVGDTALDEESARQAGCFFIHAAYGFGRAASPDAVIGTPEELVALIRSLNKEEAHV